MAAVDFSEFLPRDQQKKTPPPKGPVSFDKFIPTKAFDQELNTTLGAGRWRDTGDYRSPARENQLRSQGAATVRPGAVSNHSRGTPDAPGAHDIAVADPNAVLPKVRNLPGVKDAFYEGAAGTQGGHIHVDADQGPVDFSQFAPKATPQPQAKGPVDFSQFMPKAAPQAQPKAAPAKGPVDFSQFLPQMGEAFKDIPREINRQTQAAAQTTREDFTRPYSKDHKILDVLTRPGKLDLDLLNQAFAPITGAATSIVGRPVEKTTGVPREVTGNIVSMATPFLGEANEALAAAKLARESGLSETVARQVLQRLREAPMPKGAGENFEPPATGRRPKGRPLAADHPAAFGPGQEHTAPRSPLHEKVRPVVGDEANPATRTANALYRLQGGNVSDRIEMQQFRQGLPKELKAPKAKEGLYHALEEPLVNPDAKITSTRLQRLRTELDPYLREQDEGYKTLKAMNDPDVDEYLESSGYVHRIKEGEPNILEPEGGAPRSPFESKKSLITRPDSMKSRKYIVLEAPDGTRVFPKQDDPNDKTYSELRPGMTFRPAGEGTKGVPNQTFEVKQPTTKEIEANTKTRYQKDAVDNTLANVMQIRRAIRNKEALSTTLEDMKSRGVAHRTGWWYRDDDGKLQFQKNNNVETPKGFVQIPDNPHVRDWVFDKNDSQVQELKDWVPKQNESWVDQVDRFNNFALRSNFLSPFIHPMNIAEFWGASRGWDWFTPQGYASLARTMPAAIKEVMTMGPTYKAMLREGSALLSGDARTRNFTEMLTHKAGKELVDDPGVFEAIKKGAALPFMKVADLYTAFQQASHKMMWTVSDFMMMQRVMELKARGYPVRDAIQKAEDVIPNYRVPAQIMDSPTGGRILHHLFANNRFFSVGRYHYNKAAAWGRMAKKITTGTNEEKIEALGQLLAIGVIAGTIVPALNKAAQIATGNPNARLRQGGITSYVKSYQDLKTGKEGPEQAIASVVDFSPEAELTKEEVSQKDYFGRDLWNKFGSTRGNVAREVENPMEQFGPLEQGTEALDPNYGPGRVAGRQVGLELPQRAPGQVKGSTARMLRHSARRQERKDPILNLLGDQ